MSDTTGAEQAVISSAISSINSRPWLVELVEDFQRGIQISQRTIVTPDAIISEGVSYASLAAVSAANHVFETMHPEAPQSFKEMARRMAAELAEKPEIKNHTDKIRDSQIARWETSDVMAPVLLWVRQAGLVRAWASLEAFASDLWIQVLNRASRTLRTGAFQAVIKTPGGGEGSGLGRKQIDVAFLLRHDFNLQDRIGTVLAEKFSFKTVEGIVAAYEAAFGWDKRTATPGFHNVEALRRIERKRHVIVHRGGHIDHEYASKAGLQEGSIGNPLELSKEGAVDDVNEILVQGGFLAARTALWLDAVDGVQIPSKPTGLPSD